MASAKLCDFRAIKADVEKGMENDLGSLQPENNFSCEDSNK